MLTLVDQFQTAMPHRVVLPYLMIVGGGLYIATRRHLQENHEIWGEENRDWFSMVAGSPPQMHFGFREAKYATLFKLSVSKNGIGDVTP